MRTTSRSAWPRPAEATSSAAQIHEQLALAWVGDAAAGDASGGAKDVRGGAFGIDDVANVEATGNEGVGDEGAVAVLRDRLRAHDRGGRDSGNLQQCGEVGGELVGLHVVGVAAKGRFAHARVERVGARAPVAAEAGDVGISHVGRRQVAGERGGVEVWMAARVGEAPDVHHARHAVRAQQREEAREGASGVADRPHRHGGRQPRFLRSRRSKAPGRRRGSSPRGKICVFCTFWVPVVGSVGRNSSQPGALK